MACGSMAFFDGDDTFTAHALSRGTYASSLCQRTSTTDSMTDGLTGKAVSGAHARVDKNGERTAPSFRRCARVHSIARVKNAPPSPAPPSPPPRRGRLAEADRRPRLALPLFLRTFPVRSPQLGRRLTSQPPVRNEEDRDPASWRTNERTAISERAE